MIQRTEKFKQFPLNIAGSSTFGRYPKISLEKTYNMFISDGWLVDYAGYQTAISASAFNNARVGRAIHTSTKLNKLVIVMDNRVFLVDLFFNHNMQMSFDTSVIQIGMLETITGSVYITENNTPIIALCDGVQIYLYNPNTNIFSIATRDGTNPISFVPNYIDFHDTYFLVAASNDTINSPPSNNTWRLSSVDGSGNIIFADDAASVGLLQTKPDNVQAVVRFPSRGNLIFVIGLTVAEPWFNVGYQLFPYQRSSSSSIDYGCLNAATVASTDEIVAWLAQNEKSGPIIVASTGGMPKKITTDGIDYFLSQLRNPADSRAFIYRQDGHLFYHINFYTDNTSLFYDFNTDKFYHACDESGNYFVADSVAFFNNQYYFVTRNNGNLYAFDTIFPTYDGLEIPRIRICQRAALPSQEYFIANDLGFTIEQGEIPIQQQEGNTLFIITQDGKQVITQGSAIFIQTQDGEYVVTQDDKNIVSQQVDNTDFFYVISNNKSVLNIVPRVDLSISIDGGQSFSSKAPYYLNPLGKRKNKLQWWGQGAANELTCMFEFWGLGRFVATDGIINVRQ